MKNKILLITVNFFIFTAIPANAIFEGIRINPIFCQTASVRETVVYIDDMMMVENKFEWVYKLEGKLAASLAPGERTTVVKLSPKDGTSLEIWQGCWPDYTVEKRLEISKNHYIFSKNPLDELQEQQTLFKREIHAALSSIYNKSKRTDAQYKFTSEKAPDKQILRALSSDEARFSNSANTIRAIIYSDMAENSDLGSPFKPQLLPQSASFAEKLGTHFPRSVFYAYGVGEDVDLTSDKSFQENSKAFWLSTLRRMSATIGGFGSDLSVANRIPVKSWKYELNMQYDNDQLDGKLSILTDNDGYIVDSWLGFNRLNVSGLTGTFHCKPDQCKLDGETTSNLTTDGPSENLILSGNADSLNGTLGINGRETLFTLTAKLVHPK